MGASLLKHLHTPRAGVLSRAWRSAAGIMVIAILIAVTGAYASNAGQEGTPGPTSASPVASPAGSPVAIDLGPSTQIIVGEITVRITDEAIIPVHFESAVGRDVTIHVVNEGTTLHNFSIEEFEIDIDLQPGEQATVEIDGPQLGTYRYFSDLSGDEELEGTMTIFI